MTQERKIPALLTLLEVHQPDSSIVFCNRKQKCRDTAEVLRKHGHSVKALHGDLDQSERDEAMIQFDNGSVSTLVATDVAARGLDITALSAVFNVDMAQDPETHVRRIGRTGRAGRAGRAGNSGLAISLTLTIEQHRMLALEDYQDSTLVQETLDIVDTGYLTPPASKTLTLHVRGGKKDKLRPGDIVGALTADNTLSKDDIGKIIVLDKHTYMLSHATLLVMLWIFCQAAKSRGAAPRSKNCNSALESVKSSYLCKARIHQNPVSQ